MAWLTVIHKGKDKIVLFREGVEIANIIIANSSKTNVCNLSIEASDIRLKKVKQ